MEDVGIDSSGFWTKVDTSIKNAQYGYFKDSTIKYVVFDDSVRMEPFVRSEEVMFTQLAKDISKNKGYLAVINAQVYGVSKLGMMDYAVGSDPVDPEYIHPEGLVIKSGRIIAGRAAPLNFHIANYPQQSLRYKFGCGSAPNNAGAAIGGAGPLIIDGLPYGPINTYKAGEKPGRRIGQPSPENTKSLTQRSNATFKAFSEHATSPRTGITAIAHSMKKKKVAIFVHEDNSGSLPLATFRNKLGPANTNAFVSVAPKKSTNQGARSTVWLFQTNDMQRRVVLF